MIRHRYCLFFVVSVIVAGCEVDPFENGRYGTRPGGAPEATPNPTPPDPWFHIEIQQSAHDAADVLIAVDDSCSMGEEQAALAASIQDLGRYLFDNTSLDARVSVYRADLSQGIDGQAVGTPLYIDATVNDPTVELATRITSLGSGGSGTCESGLAAIYLAINDALNNGYNAGVVRTDTPLTVLIMTDEPEQGVDGNCGYPQAEPSTWAAWLTDLHVNSPAQPVFCTIAGFSVADNITPSSCSSAYGSASAAPRLGAVASLLGGITQSICSQNWSPFLQECGFRASGLQTEFVVPVVPSLDYDDFDGDGDLTERALYVEIDRLDGLGFVDLPTDDLSNPWVFNSVSNRIVFEWQIAPLDGWVLRISALPGS